MRHVTVVRASHPKLGIAWALLALLAAGLAAQDPPAVERPNEASTRGLQDVPDQSSPLSRGRAALGERRMEEAVVEFRQAVADEPENAEARVGLGRALALLGREGEAMEQYRLAADIDSSNAAARVGMGEVLRVQGEFDQALHHLRAGIELDPAAERARMAEVQVLHAQGRFREVLERLEEAHEVLPTSGLAAYGLAWTLAASPDPSLRDGERALDLGQAVFESHQSLPNAELVAEALAELDRCQKAAEWLRGVAGSIDAPEASPEIAARLQRGIERFEQGPPCRAVAEAVVADE